MAAPAAQAADPLPNSALPPVAAPALSAGAPLPCAGWVLTKPMNAYIEAICASCEQPIYPREVRIRCGKRGARVHHVKCVRNYDLPIENINGFANLPAEDRPALQNKCPSPAAPPTSAPTESSSLRCAPVVDAELAEGICLLHGPIRTELDNMQFWDQINMDQAVDPIRSINTVPVQCQVAVARLRSEVARCACAEEPHAAPDPNCWTFAHQRALKCFIFLDRILFALPAKQSPESLTALLARRIRHAWLGDWHLLWQESDQKKEANDHDEAAENNDNTRRPPEGNRKAKRARTEEQTTAKELKELRALLMDDDARGALRYVRERGAIAEPDVARKALPRRFPAAERQLPSRRHAQAPDPSDLETWFKNLEDVTRSLPTKRGTGPGGSRHEHWSFLLRM